MTADQAKGFPNGVDQLARLRCRLDAFRAANKQRIVKRLAQTRQRVRYRRLAHAETLGGPADVVVGVDRLENNEKVEVHVLEICGHCTNRSNAWMTIVWLFRR